MKIGFDKIKEITLGVSRITNDGGIVRFFRFTKEQEAFYERTSPGSYKKSFSTAGVRLVFKTDSKKMFIKIIATKATSRSYFALDVFADGKSVGSIDNYSGADISGDYTVKEFPTGDFSKSFELGDGIKEVTVYLPWSADTGLTELALDEGSFVEAVRPKKKMIVFGDSITHGYDALHPSERYPAMLADVLRAEEINKAIGGAVFQPPLAECRDEIDPDYITVAYGTNDWNKYNATEYFEKCHSFYSALSRNYPDAKIFALTPIWRKDCDEIRLFGSFYDIDGTIRRAVATLPNVTVISCFDFVPKDENMFTDYRLHPNGEGFRHYFKNLSAEMLRILK